MERVFIINFRRFWDFSEIEKEEEKCFYFCLGYCMVVGLEGFWIFYGFGVVVIAVVGGGGFGFYGFLV